jgi:hypothetical protein
MLTRGIRASRLARLRVLVECIASPLATGTLPIHRVDVHGARIEASKCAYHVVLVVVAAQSAVAAWLVVALGSAAPHVVIGIVPMAHGVVSPCSSADTAEPDTQLGPGRLFPLWGVYRPGVWELDFALGRDALGRKGEAFCPGHGRRRGNF